MPATSRDVDHFDICIIGAGVVGLALARQLSLRFPDCSLVVLEQHALPGSETSSRNSEVIHAGLYYPPGSLKATSCLRGRDLLYRFCAEHQIPHQRCGKLIVGSHLEGPQLAAINKNLEACGAQALQYLDQQVLRRLEPELRAELALFSPNTGIIDSHAFMNALAAQAEANGAVIVCNTRFVHAEEHIDAGSGRLLLISYQQAKRGSAEISAHLLSSRGLINCAGLHATQVASKIDLEDSSKDLPPVTYIKGNYFSYSGRSPFKHLIYPVPDQQHRGLGIHATLDLHGCCRFGPDIEELDQQCFDPGSPDYCVADSRRQQFVEHIRNYFPDLRPERLQPDYSGIRTRAHAVGVFADFCLRQHTSSHCAVLHWIGIESPGLTASLALAEMTEETIRKLQIFP